MGPAESSLVICVQEVAYDREKKKDGPENYPPFRGY